MNAEDLAHAFRAEGTVVIRFIAAFSRFEYALKRWRYFRPHPTGDYGEAYAEADWTKLGKKLDQFFRKVKTRELLEAVNYLLNEPPKTEAVLKSQDGQDYVTFDHPLTVHHPSQLVKLLLHIKVVRNNLFHGGKGTPGLDDQRNTRLLSDSLIVLDEVLRLSRFQFSCFYNAVEERERRRGHS